MIQWLVSNRFEFQNLSYSLDSPVEGTTSFNLCWLVIIVKMNIFSSICTNIEYFAYRFTFVLCQYVFAYFLAIRKHYDLLQGILT